MAQSNYLFKELWDRPKGGPSSRSTGNLAYCCHETGESARCGTVPVPPITEAPKLSKSWLIRGAAQYLGKMKEGTVGEKKGAHELNQLPTSLIAFRDQLREGLRIH